VCLIINDRVDIALVAGAGGVHLGQDDLPPDAARRILGENAVIGLSTHNAGQAEAAICQSVNYIAVGPIFETGTKTDHSPVIGLEGLAAVRRSVGDFPLVAIGGITPERLAEVFDAGADSAAMIAGLLAEPARITEVYRTLDGRAGEL
jgi:thiamine-phosphate pyrophosphorylase